MESMIEQGKQLENFNPKEKRNRLFSHLDYAIALSREKAGKEKAATEDRQRWVRIMISAVEAYGKLLNEAQLDEIENRLGALEYEKTRILEPLSTPVRENLLDRLKREENERKAGTQHD